RGVRPRAGDVAAGAPGLRRQHQVRALVRHPLVRRHVAAARECRHLGALPRPRAVPRDLAAASRGDSARRAASMTEEREPAHAIRAPASRRERMLPWAAVIRADAQRLAQRAQVERGRHRSVDAVFEMADRDSEVGGGIIAGALAYRLFIWLLPLALIAVAGLGIAADASSKSPEEAAKSLGLEGVISNSIANAANSPNRWYALVIGIPVLIWEQNHYWSANFPDSTRR